MFLTQFRAESSFGHRLAESELGYWRQIVTQLEEYREEDKAAFSTIVAVCNQHGLTQGKLADEFRVSTATISRWPSPAIPIGERRRREEA